MRREGRRMEKRENSNTWIYVVGSVLGVLMIVFAIVFSIYSNNVKKNSNVSLLDTGKVPELVPSVTDMGGQSESASTEIGRTVDEMMSMINNGVSDGNSVSNTRN